MTPLEKAQLKIDTWIDKWIENGDVEKPLYLGGLDLTVIPEGMLPPTLQVLHCHNNQLTSLPALPPTLQELFCYNNQLTSLPTLPPTLKNLSCRDNQLTSLPALPPTLQALLCYNNQLTSLPTLPPTLQNLYCNNNQLVQLPELPPTLERVWCDNNQLTSLPELPPTLVYINYNNNPCHNQFPQQIQQQQIQIQQPQQPKQINTLSIPKHVTDLIIQTTIQKGETCPILHDPLQENGCILTSCFHIFSKEGFTEWSKKSSECPTCRQKCSVLV